MKKIILLIAPLFFLSCASTRKLETTQIKSVRSFAITGFSAYLPFSNLSSNAAVKHSAATDEMYDSMGSKMSAFLKAKAIKRSDLVTQPAYVKAYDATMKGFQNKNIDMSSMRYEVDKVMDNDCIRLLDVTGREQLMKALNVDALVSLEVRVSLAGMTVMGLGTRKPQTQVFIQMFKRGIETPIWFETLVGETSNESVGATGFINEDKLRELALASFKTALVKMSWEENAKN